MTQGEANLQVAEDALSALVKHLSIVVHLTHSSVLIQSRVGVVGVDSL